MRKGAIFDMDGLLLDTERVYRDSWIETAKAFHQPVIPEFPKAVSGTNGESMARVIRQWYPEVDPWAFMDDCIARVNDRVDREGPEVKTGVREILSGLRRRGAKIAVASSSGRDRILSNLGAVGLLEFFDVVVSGQEVAQGKPAPDIFLLAAERCGCAPEDCCVFEDSLNGIRAAIAAGCGAVMVPDLTPPPEEPEGFTVCGSLLEAWDWMEAGTL